MIGIVAPYSRSETTAAAIRLANLVLDYGSEVHLMSLGPQEQDIHPFWDQRVWSTKGDGVYYAAHKCDTLVHFQLSHNVRQMCELVADSARQILIPQLHQLRPEDTALILDHDAIICPTQGAKKSLLKFVFQGIEPTGSAVFTWARFTSGLPYVRRNGNVTPGRTKLCLLVNSSVTEVYGGMLLRLLRELLDRIPQLDVTLISNKSWSEVDRKLVKQLTNDYSIGTRFQGLRAQNLDDLSQEFHAHDWVMIPWTKADFGIMVGRALACGTPVMAFDVEPFNEIITNNHNGILIPCELQLSKLNAMTAVPAYDTLLETCLSALHDNRTLRQLQAVDWRLDAVDASFHKFWGKTLGLCKE